MGDSKPYLRLFTFGGVLILVSGLLVGLFSGAGAVNMFFEEHNGQASGSEQFTVNIEIPEDQTVPIEALDAVLEKQDEDRDDKIGAEVVARESCPMEAASTDCSFEGPITRIQVGGFFVDGEEVSEAAAFGYAQGRTAERTGYGYDDVSGFFQSNGYGYGYGYETGDTSEVNLGDGYGYGYAQSGDLTIQVDITVNANQLDIGSTYYLTALADTGVGVLGELSSPFTEFQATSSSGGGTPSGPGGDDPGSGADAPPIVGEPGESFDVEVDGKVHLTNLGPGFSKLGTVFNQACNGCSIQFSVNDQRGAQTPDPADSGFQGKGWFTVEVRDADGNVVEDAVDEVFLEFEVDQDDLDEDEAPQHVVLLHHVNPWEPEPTDLVSDADADPLEYNATLSGFSEFAVATDGSAPAITNAEPTGEIDAGTPQISADFEDNRGIDTDSFELLLDGDEVTSADGSLTVNEDGFTYVPAESLTEARYEVEATIQDTSGHEATESWSFQVADIACDPSPAIVNVDPADGATGVSLDSAITVTVQEGECPLDATTLTVDGEEVDTTYTDGQLRANLPGSVEDGDTVSVTATVTDTSANVAERSWSFTASDAPDDGPAPGPSDEGLSGLAWTIIALIVLAVIGVAAYFYTQRASP